MKWDGVGKEVEGKKGKEEELELELEVRYRVETKGSVEGCLNEGSRIEG